MTLLQVMKYALKKKLVPPGILLEVKFKTNREETDAIFLDENEIKLLCIHADIRTKQ